MLMYRGRKFSFTIFRDNQFFVFLAFVIDFLQIVRTQNTSKPILQLKHIIPDDYDSLIPPGQGEAVTVVQVEINLKYIRDIDEMDMSYCVDVMLNQKWVDRRLTYPAFQKTGRSLLKHEWLDKVWHPELAVSNLIEGRVSKLVTSSMQLRVTKDHNMSFATRLLLKLDCYMELSKFPHDTQECDILLLCHRGRTTFRVITEIFGLYIGYSITINLSALYTIQEVRLEWSNPGLVFAGRTSLAQFTVLNFTSSSYTKNIFGLTRSYLKGTLLFERKVGYYFMNVYIPTILIVLMSMLTFWIPPDAVPARVTLGVTSLLTMITKQYQAGMPSVSYIVALNVWLSCCIAFVFCSLLEYAVVIALTTEKKNLLIAKEQEIKTAWETEGKTSNVSNAWNKDKNNPLYKNDTNPRSEDGRLRRCNRSDRKISNAPKTPETRKTFPLEQKKTFSLNPQRIDQISRVLFPVAFLLQTFIYWGYYGGII